MSHCAKIRPVVCLDIDLCLNSCLHGLTNTTREVQQQAFQKKKQESTESTRKKEKLHNKKLE